MSYQQITYSVADLIATITLNRPEQLNTWSDVMADEVHQAMHAACCDEQVRVIILTGAGRAFCAGADITGFVAKDPRRLIDKLPRTYDFSARPDFQSRATYFPSLSKPVIAMLNGPTAGIGLIHALFCDMRFASEEAVLTTAFSRIGLVSEYGMAWMLRHVVGHANALDLLLSARKVKGEEARRLGLVNQIFPPSELQTATYAYARDLAENASPRSLRILKRQLWYVPFQTLEEAVRTDCADMMESNVCEDFVEGKRAFVEKRKPRFTGK
jgi:enoyl-CoA hydratase/carnithine racemase